jgi:putative membrane-bound dehydrogenase-like protein
MRGYPFPESTPSSDVCLLEDRDGDGRFETRKAFLGQLSWPTSVVPFDDGVFITTAPDIVFAKDTNGDGVADLKKVMFSGFGVENVQGLVNGLMWGPDGWIYGVTSSNGGTITNRLRPDAKPVALRGRDFRFRPDGSAFEAISGGGQFGQAFDDWGHRFTCNNSNHARQIVLPARYLERNPALTYPPAVIDIAVEGPAAPVFRASQGEPWRLVRTRQRAADPVLSRRLPATELVATGFFTSATGVTVYRGSAYPPEYHGNLFVGDVGGNLVHRKIVFPDGAAFRARRADEKSEFLRSTDNWFRPVNFANTPQGTLLILDMYRETIEHPLSIPEPIKRHLDLTSGKDRGRLYELVSSQPRPRRPQPKLKAAPSIELVPLLADADSWWRETAQRLLFERQDRSVKGLLESMVKDRPNPLGRLHAIWTLDLLGVLDPAIILLGLDDPDARVREQVVRVAESRLSSLPTLKEKILRLSLDPDPMVRFQLAFSLGEIQDDSRVINALAEISSRDRASSWTRLAVMSSSANRSLRLFEALSRNAEFFAGQLGQTWLGDLAASIGADANPQAARAMLLDLDHANAPAHAMIRATLAMAEGRRRVRAAIGDLAAGPTLSVLAKLRSEARRIAGQDGPTEVRVDAIQWLELWDETATETVLADLLDARQPVTVQLAVLQALANRIDRPRARSIIGHWKAMSPGVRREAIEALLRRPIGVDELLGSLESRLIAPSELDPSRLKQLETSPDSATRTRSIRIISGLRAGGRDRKESITQFSRALELAGNREHGRVVFSNACAGCHKAEELGVNVGPSLLTVVNRSPENLLTQILDPNREVAPNFVNYLVALKDGRTVTGMIVDESATTMTLLRAQAATEVILRDQIETIQSTGLSLMPEGLEKGLQLQDIADLIAFIRSLGSPPASAPNSMK